MPPFATSHALDPAAAEDPLGAQHQDEDHQHVRREILGAAADKRIEITSGQIFDNADDQPADNGADDRIQPAEDHHRENLETDKSELVVNAEHRSPYHAAERGDDPRH